MNSRIEQFVRNRAGHRCEYCHLPQSAHPQRFPVDHIVPRKHKGSDEVTNLALCCPHCNWHKGPNLTGIDPVTGNIVPLFHPRRDIWFKHFRWLQAKLIGRTPTGRATIEVMCINDEQRIELRKLAGWR